MGKVRVRRILAIAVAIGGHLALVLIMLRPPGHAFDTIVGTHISGKPLELRFVPRPPAPTQPPTSSRASIPVFVPAKARAAPSSRRLSQPASPTATLTEKPALPPAPPPASPSIPDASRVAPALSGDGGFAARLAEAQHAQDIHGVPGSTRRITPGMDMINPRHQGIGAAVRFAQRLLGVVDRHCIDVAVWNSLTDEERAARPVSPSDMRKESDYYECEGTHK